jgi:hypothetical protein
MYPVKRTITGRTATRTMSLGDLRQFIGSLDGLPDEADVKARVTFRKYLREVTVEEDDSGFRDFVRAVDSDKRRAAEPKQVRGGKASKESTAV